jgi:hypothetical protein
LRNLTERNDPTQRQAAKPSQQLAQDAGMLVTDFILCLRWMRRVMLFISKVSLARDPQGKDGMHKDFFSSSMIQV